jgi:sugar lactone lactonase YvrE
MTANRSVNRYPEDAAASVDSAWQLDPVLAPSAMYGANGLRFGPNGHLYVAQAFGSQISEVDPATGAVTTVSPVGSEIVAPDDLAFDSDGALYATEVFSERVSVRTPDGQTRVLADQLPVANGITVHQDRIFVDEFRVGGRVLELYRDGRAPRVIAQDLVLPNALSAGPDGYLYFPLVVNGEVARVPIEGGPVEIFVNGLSLPTAVKFDVQGRLVVVQSGNGEITRFELPTRQATRIAQVRTGMDNLAFSPSGELYVSNFSDGGISRIGADGSETVLIGRGLLGPYGLATSAEGEVYIADGMSYAVLARNGVVTRPSMLLTHGFPGYVRGVALSPDGALYFSNSAGGVASFVPGKEAVFLATDLDQLMALRVSREGSVPACEAGAGRLLELRADGQQRVLAQGMQRPTGLAVALDGSCYVSEAAAGRVVHCRHGEKRLVLGGLIEPHGLTLVGDQLFVLDRGGKSLHVVSLLTGAAQCVARGLPVGPAPGVLPKTLPGIAGVMPGPLLPFADLATAADGAVLVSGDGEGSLLRLRPRAAALAG